MQIRTLVTMLVDILLGILSLSQAQELGSTPVDHIPEIISGSEYHGLSTSSYTKATNGGHIPQFFDWRTLNMVTPVKGQLQCNACWAFSIVGAVESHLLIHTYQNITLSEQFLLDCVSINNGCDHASLLQTYGFIVNQLGGILRSKDYYAYKARQLPCRWSPPNQELNAPGTKVAFCEGSANSHAYPMPVIGFTRVKSDEDEMAYAVFTYGPITAAINSASMGEYAGGIDEPTDENCDPTVADHTVVIVGYNEYVPKDPRKRSVKYWIIKNSWGTEWGDDGFYYLVRGRNACGIANDVSMPFVSMYKTEP